MTDKISIALILAAAMTNAAASSVMRHAYGGDGAMLSGGIVNAVLRIASNPLTLAGIALFGVSFFFMAAALSRSELTFAYPLMSAVVYLVLLAAGFLIFHEKITAARVCGTLLILAGITVLAKG
ncbi:hypothetical protein [Cloacibacillus sp. An23]|uniref:hypothetical protein n=1 Tax=Cloacibacillus sp. An23 TaxID=1965591 RepID=UPI000B3946BB|nr:hypothetical protein [Cloacibacillus sp. An23]OUO93293.1 hypothetical protein B5F39_08325 [Cloacibacillus sp. An23]